MLQLTENKPRQHTQIAKKSINGLPLFSFVSCPLATAKTVQPGSEHMAYAPNWSFPRLDATLLSALPARDIRHFLHTRGKR